MAKTRINTNQLKDSQGWYPDTSTWSYSSVDSPTGIISINSDMTSKLQKGMRIKYNQEQALTGYWSFDTNSTPEVGGFTMTDIGTLTSAYTAGKFGNALTLNGTDQALAVTDTALLKPTGEFTIGCRCKSNDTGVAQRIFQSYSVNPTNLAGIILGIGSNDKISVVIANNTGTTQNANWNQLDGTTIINDGAYHYVVLSFRNNFLQIYIDGRLEASSYSLAPAYGSTNYVRIGCSNTTGTNAGWFNGQIDDLFLINGYALDEETIRAKYLADTAQGSSNINVTKKAIVTDVGAYSGGNTLVTAYHGTDFMLSNATITSPYYSSVKVPFGFNINPDKWSVIVQDSTTRAQVASGTTIYNIASLSITAPIGSWNLSLEALFQIYHISTSGVKTMTISMSNSNSSINGNMVVGFSANAVLSLRIPIYKVFSVLNLASKATYYLTERDDGAGGNTLYLINSESPLIIKVTSAYL